MTEEELDKRINDQMDKERAEQTILSHEIESLKKAVEKH